MRALTGWGCLGAIAALVSSLTATGSLASERLILGRTIDPDGAVVADAMVYLTPVNRANGPQLLSIHTLRSDHEGVFYVALPPGRYRVAAVKLGYDVTMTEIHSRALGVLRLEMTRPANISLGNRPVGAPEENLGTGWILRQKKDNVLRAARPQLADAAVRHEKARPAASIASDGGWAAALFAPIDGRFVQQFSGGAPFGGDGEAPVGWTTGLSLEGTVAEDSFWRFDGWAGRAIAEVDNAGGRLEDRNDRAAIGLDYRLGERDTVAGGLWYGSRRYVVEAGGGTAGGTEQEQRTFAMRSRWERQVDSNAALYVEGEYFETAVRLPGRRLADGQIADRHWFAATGLALRVGEHSIDLGVATEQYDYDLWNEGVLLHGREIVPGPGIDAGAGPAFSLRAADRWRIGALTEVNYGLGYHSQPRSGATYMVPRVGVTLTPPGTSGVVLRSEVLYRLDGDPRSVAPGEDLQAGGDGEKIGYLIGIERRPHQSDDSLHMTASYSFLPFVDGWPGGGISGRSVTPGGTPLVLGDGATSRHEVDVEVAHAFGAFRGRLAGKLGLAEGRLTPAMDEAPVQILTEGEARYFQTQLWATFVQTDTEVQVDYRRVLVDERQPGAALEPTDYRRLDLVVYQQIPGPRVLRDARLRVLMAYQGFDYDSLYDAPDGAVFSGRASRLTGGLDITF